MSINWVMLSNETTHGFAVLPGEQRLYTSPPRTALSITSLNKNRGKDSYSVQSSVGCVHLTNRRIVYLPANPTQELESFTTPILNLRDTHVNAPFFGPNVWTGLLQPVQGGGLPPQHGAFEMKMTFKDGGAFDFHSTFERVKERLQQALEVARESGQLAGNRGNQGGASNADDLNGIDLNTVHLDELPAYESSGGQGMTTGNATTRDGQFIAAPVPVRSTSTDQAPSQQGGFVPPTEPPPGYEEVQHDSIADELERRLRRDSS